MYDAEGKRLTVATFAKQLRSGKLTSRAVVEQCLQNIAAIDGKMRAFQNVDWSAASAADRVDEAIAAGRGHELSPLAGAPVAVKELFQIEGFPKATAGTLMDVSHVIGSEGRFVQLLRQAGCIIIGTVKTTEFAMAGTGVNDAFGTPWNPVDQHTHRLAGGSSCGSGVAVACGMSLWAVGTDTGGSIRVPASMCGLVGLKPTAGCFPSEGCFPLSSTYDSIGPLCLTAEDAALIFHTLASMQPSLPRCSLPDPHTPPAATSIATLRLGVPRRLFEGLEPAVEIAVRTALDLLRGLGATLLEFELPYMEVDQVWSTIVSAEVLAAIGQNHMRANRAAVSQSVWGRIEPGFDTLAVDYLAATSKRAQLARTVYAQMQSKRIDALVAPTCKMVAPIYQKDCSPRGFGANTMPANIAGLCAISIPLLTEPSDLHQLSPLSFESPGESTARRRRESRGDQVPPLPVGFQIMSPPGAEDSLLAIAVGIERALGSAGGTYPAHSQQPPRSSPKSAL
jgi:aspartyl-tRNA(Asn)/glutamyl-tRNA(Gln) amidotransferase subunit A